MQKVVIAGSAGLQEEVTKWLKYFKNLNYEGVYLVKESKRN